MIRRKGESTSEKWRNDDWRVLDQIAKKSKLELCEIGTYGEYKTEN